jgi:hypothetical protein
MPTEAPAFAGVPEAAAGNIKPARFGDYRCNDKYNR